MAGVRDVAGVGLFRTREGLGRPSRRSTRPRQPPSPRRRRPTADVWNLTTVATLIARAALRRRTAAAISPDFRSTTIAAGKSTSPMSATRCRDQDTNGKTR
jgi:hypothetical protein